MAAKTLSFLSLCVSVSYFFSSVCAQDTATTGTANQQKKRPPYELHPNWAAKGLMTPSGWGSSGTFVFGFIGGTFPQVYADRGDMGAGIGAGFGNSRKTVSVVGIFNIHNVSEFNTFSGSFIASRYLGKGSSISAGALQLFAGPRSDAGPSYYVAFSHASQTLESRTRGYSRLAYTLGIGSGRFYEKSPKDITEGKGRYGTAVFGNISLGLLKNLNLTLEWTGQNLAIGTGWRPRIPIRFPINLPSINIGVADLLRTSGDGPRFVMGIGHSFRIKAAK